MFLLNQSCSFGYSLSNQELQKEAIDIVKNFQATLNCVKENFTFKKECNKGKFCIGQ